MAKTPLKYVSLDPSAFTGDAEFQSWGSDLCGAYCCIIFTLYQNEGRIENDPSKIRRIAHWEADGWEQAWKVLRKKFQHRGKHVRHKRVTIELRRARDQQQTYHTRGVAGAAARYGKDASSNASSIAREGKGSKGKVEAQSAFRSFTDLYCRLWEEKHRVKYSFAGAQDGKAARTILEHLGESELSAESLINAYLSDPDPFYEGHPLSKLASKGILPKFIARAAGQSAPVVDERLQKIQSRVVL